MKAEKITSARAREYPILTRTQCLLTVTIMAMSFPAVWAQSPAVEPENPSYPAVYEPDYNIDLKPGEAVGIVPGAGFALSDPLFPKRRASPFKQSLVVRAPADGLPKPADLLQVSARFMEVNESAEEARRLALGFGARFGIVKGAAAYETAKRELEKKTVMYVEIEISDVGERLADTATTWATPPASDGIEDPRESLRQLLLDYGSHYVTTVYYGQRIMIRASYDQKDTEDALRFKASIKALAATWSGNVSLSVEQSQMLSSSRTEVESLIISGGVTPQSASYRVTFQDVRALLEDLKTDKVKIASGPIRCAVQTYWHTLAQQSRTRKLLTPKQAFVPVAPYGVPKGTIIPWLPTPDLISIDAAGKPTVDAPNGWAICDGKNGTPDLRNRFLLGAADLVSAKRLVGSEAHQHAVKGRTSTQEYHERLIWASDPSHNTIHGQLSDLKHTHGVDLMSDPASNIPPALTVIYIMRVTD